MSVSLALDRKDQRYLSLLQELFSGATVDFTVRLWNGLSLSFGCGAPRFTLVLHHPGTLRRMFWPCNQLTLGEAYIGDDYDIEGDIESCFRLADHLLVGRRGWFEKARCARRLLALPLPKRRGADGIRLRGKPHSPQRDATAVAYHYNVSNDFYRLWLDPRMVYSCACFRHPEDSLEQAQAEKLDYLCRKLRLRKGERLLDIGCGWGGLIRHAARHYGVEAVGITLSQPQADLANERIGAEGLADCCRAEVRDYRSLDRAESFDKIVSVGMCEHVGRARLSEYFFQAFRLLRRGGVFLNHGITESQTGPSLSGPSFIDSHVFPDSELVPIAETLLRAEACGFEVRDLESLREHYALTLQHWIRNLESRRAEAVRIAGESVYRIWRLYMAGSAHGFRTGRLNVYQALFVKCAGPCGLPMTRADWYR
jgi:cyclopropane-fatty-acyl-phospholipid synthase